MPRHRRARPSAARDETRLKEPTARVRRAGRGRQGAGRVDSPANENPRRRLGGSRARPRLEARPVAGRHGDLLRTRESRDRANATCLPIGVDRHRRAGRLRRDDEDRPDRRRARAPAHARPRRRARQAAASSPSGRTSSRPSSRARRSSPRLFMRKYEIPTPEAEVCTDARARRRSAVKAFGLPCVFKADGLAAGKGVVVVRRRGRGSRAALKLFFERPRLRQRG